MNLLKENTGHNLSVCYDSYSHGYCIITLNEGTPPLSSLPSLSYYHNQLSIGETERETSSRMCASFPSSLIQTQLWHICTLVLLVMKKRKVTLL